MQSYQHPCVGRTFPTTTSPRCNITAFHSSVNHLKDGPGGRSCKELGLRQKYPEAVASREQRQTSGVSRRKTGSAHRPKHLEVQRRPLILCSGGGRSTASDDKIVEQNCSIRKRKQNSAVSGFGQARVVTRDPCAFSPLLTLIKWVLAEPDRAWSVRPACRF
jgi:hypothetical protein